MCHVSSSLAPHGMHHHAMCPHIIRLFASKYIKFQLSRNSTKFDCVPRPTNSRLRETKSSAWSVSSSEIERNFQTYNLYCNGNLTFHFSRVFTFELLKIKDNMLYTSHSSPNYKFFSYCRPRPYQGTRTISQTHLDKKLINASQPE